jgi:hypothetical protein
LPNPNFSGTWSTTDVSTVSAINRTDKQKVATLGSGWGEKISILHHSNNLDIERVVFTPRELQPTVSYHFTIESSTENNINTGRSQKPVVSTTKWQENRLIITSLFPIQDPNRGVWQNSKMTQTLWLEAATNAPWEPNLIVETKRESILGGFTSTNRTVYSRGYR